MLHKKILISLLSLFINYPSLYENVSTEPVEIIGNVNMTDIYESATLKLELTKIHPWAYLYVKIYKNNILIEDRKVLSLAFNDQIYNLDAINEYNTVDNYKIIVNYYQNSQIDTIVFFDNYSPSEKDYYFHGDNINIESSIPTKISFKAKGYKNDILYNNDKYIFKGYENYKLGNTRFCDFSNFSLNIVQAANEIDINEVEIKLFTKFENSDLDYNGTYTSLILEIEKEGSSYVISNNFIFYLDKINGSIKKEYDDNCYEDAFPFFIPLNAGFNKKIKYEIEFSNLNSSKEKYIIQGNIILGDTLFSLFPEDIMKEKYHYLLVDLNLEEVDYFYAQ